MNNEQSDYISNVITTSVNDTLAAAAAAASASRHATTGAPFPRCFPPGSVRSAATNNGSSIPRFHYQPPDLTPFSHTQTKLKLGTYEIDRTIGKGIFSVVKLARHTITGINLAVKIIDKTCLDADNLVKVYRESVILKKLHHPNIVKLYQVMETPKLLCLVMEHLPNGEVFDYVATHGRFPESQARIKFLDVLSAVDYTHSRGIVHRDLKAENLLFDAEMNIKLIDFTFGTHHQPTDTQSLLSTWCGTPPYAAPEIFLGEPYIGTKADIWSLGVVLYVMVCGMLPFDAQPLQHLKMQVLSASFRVPYWLSLSCERLIRSMLSKDPSKRPSTRDLFLHPWFTESSSHQPGPPPLPSSMDGGSRQPRPDSFVDSRVQANHVTERMLAATTMEPGSNLAADLELGRINEFVILIMESYGMSREKIMESLNSRAYDHLMATYLLLGEKIRQHRFSLNLPEVLHSCDNTDIPLQKHPKPSRVDSAVGSVSETESITDLSIPAQHRTSDYAVTYPSSYQSAVQHEITRSPPNHNRGFSSDFTPAPAAVLSSSGSRLLPASSSIESHLHVPSIGERIALDSAMETEQTQPWLTDLGANRNTDEAPVSANPRRSLARRKYGVFTPPANLDQIGDLARLAEEASRTMEMQTEENEDSS